MKQKFKFISLFSLILFIYGCNEEDKNTNINNNKTEQNVTQLNNSNTEKYSPKNEKIDLEKEFTKLETQFHPNRISSLKETNDLKVYLPEETFSYFENNQKINFEPEVLFQKEETIKYNEDIQKKLYVDMGLEDLLNKEENKDNSITNYQLQLTKEGKIDFKITSYLTNIEWLNKLLLMQFLNELQHNPYISPEDSKDMFKDYYLYYKALKESNLIKAKQILINHFLTTYNKEVTPLKNNEDFPQEKTFRQTIKLNNFDKIINGKYYMNFTKETYSFLGGAHGFTTLEFFTIDPVKQDIVTLNDIISFENDTSKTLVKALIKKFYEIYKNDQDFIDNFNAKDFFLTNNFFINEKGIGFIYQPYEILPYAFGHINLFLTFEELQKLNIVLKK